MATKESRELSQKKYYATERLPEIKQELLRLGAESKELKATVTVGAEESGGGAKNPEDRKAVAVARRRRSYLAARSAKLKEERDALRADLASVKTALAARKSERGKAETEAQ